MVSAAIAAFFYLRIGLIMYTPVAGKGFLPGIEPLDDDEANAGPSGESETDGTAMPHRPSFRRATGSGRLERDRGCGGGAHAAQRRAPARHRPGEVQVLDPSEDIVEADAVDDETAAESAAEDTAKVPVPALAALAIGLCVAVTVVFGSSPHRSSTSPTRRRSSSSPDRGAGPPAGGARDGGGARFHGPDEALALTALDQAGIEATMAVWDDPGVPGRLRPRVVRSTWDYTARHGPSSSGRPRSRASRTLRVLAWNTDKHYLADLERAGVPVIETRWLEPGTRQHSSIARRGQAGGGGGLP